MRSVEHFVIHALCAGTIFCKGGHHTPGPSQFLWRGCEGRVDGGHMVRVNDHLARKAITPRRARIRGQAIKVIDRDMNRINRCHTSRRSAQKAEITRQTIGAKPSAISPIGKAADIS
jgi:hypothetical protein